MAVPKRRVSKTRRNKRRSHKKLRRPNFTLCTNCRQPMLPHRVCLNCGYYKGEKRVSVKEA